MSEHGPDPIQILALRPKDAAKALGLGSRKLWELTADGTIPHVRCGRAILYPVRELQDWLADQCLDQRGRCDGEKEASQ